MDILCFSVPLWTILLLVILGIIYRMSTRTFGIFKKMGIPGPAPWPLIGNLISVLKYGVADHHKYLHKKYGKLVGTFMGKQPMLMVSDPDLVKQITVKCFESFKNRMTLKMDDPILDKMITTLKDDHWKHVRSHLSPTFSGSKLRRMVPVLNKCSSTMVKNLAENANVGDSFECREFCGSFSMDAIASSAFSLDIDTQNDKENIFVQRGKEILGRSPLPLLILFVFCPWLLPYLRKWFDYSFISQRALNFFTDITNQAIKEREENPDQSATDFLQLMITSQADSSTAEHVDEGDTQNLIVGSDGKTWDKSGLTHEEILANSFIFIIAGYMNNAHVLSFAMYNLAANPETQEKAYAEISTVLGDNKDPDYDDLKKLAYISMCVDETLRMFPPAPRLTRVASEDIEINGIHIPKDMVITIPTYWMQHDPDVWPNPETFMPERFSKEAKEEHHPSHYTPFGMGPRHCVAQRLSLIQTKLALVHILRQYKLITCDKTKIPVKLKKFRVESEDGLWIKVQPRH